MDQRLAQRIGEKLTTATLRKHNVSLTIPQIDLASFMTDLGLSHYGEDKEAAIGIIREELANQVHRGLEKLKSQKLQAPSASTGGDVLLKPINEYEDLSVRARKALQKLNASTMGDVAKLTERQLRDVRNCGETALNQIKNMLREHDLKLKEEE